MFYLLIVSLIWSFSFGLVKLVSTHDASLLAALRLLLALPLFLPFLQWRRIGSRDCVILTLLGALQYGLMYVCLFRSYAYLEAFQIALLTIFTPIYVTLLNDAIQRRFHGFYLLATLLSVGGAAVLLFDPEAQAPNWTGFFWVQASNLCFGAGQILYRHLRPRFSHLADREVYALPYAGAVLVTLLAVAANGSWRELPAFTLQEVLVLIYLGTIASGLCFFWWNKGATLVGAGTLAVMNNLKVPLAVLFAITVFGERGSPLKLAASGVFLLAALLLAEKTRKARHRSPSVKGA